MRPTQRQLSDVLETTKEACFRVAVLTCGSLLKELQVTDLVILCHSLPQAVFGYVDWLQSLDCTLHRDVLAPQVLCTSAVVDFGSMGFICCCRCAGVLAWLHNHHKMSEQCVWPFQSKVISQLQQA